MKKILLFLGLCFLFGINTTVKAKEVTLKEVNAYKGYVTKIVNGYSYYGPIRYLYFDDTLAYCLEGNITINSTSYQKEAFGNYLSEDLRKELELISYYGYEYPGHKRLEYYMAAQELIWLRLGIEEVIWSTEPLGRGTVFNIESYKDEILSLIINHSDMPSFVTPKPLKEGAYYGLNFDSYDINDYTITALHSKLEFQDNEVYITASEVGTEKITIEKKSYKNKDSYVYKSAGSQTIATFGMSSNIKSVMEYEIRPQKTPVSISTTAPFLKKDFTYESKVTDKLSYQLVANDSVYSNEGLLLYPPGGLVTNIKSVDNISLYPGNYCLVLEETPSFQGIYQCFEVLDEKIDLKINLTRRDATIRGSVLKEVFLGNKVNRQSWANQEFEIVLDKDQICDEILFTKGTKVMEFSTDEQGEFLFVIPNISYRIVKKVKEPEYERLDDLTYTMDDSHLILYYQLNRYQLTVENKEENGTPLIDGSYSIYDEDGSLLMTNSFKEKDVLLPKGNYTVRIDATKEGYTPTQNQVEVYLKENETISFINYTLQMPNTSSDALPWHFWNLIGFLLYAFFKK